jgi:hypothetical protein
MKRWKYCLPVFLIMQIMMAAGQADGQTQAASSGQMVYVSVYSHVYSGPKLLKFQLAGMLSIRNTDPAHPIIITQVDYYDSKGELVDSYIQKPLQLEALETTEFHVKEYDERGGAGANFMVNWKAEKPVSPPIIESVMLGAKSGQGISFVCPGQVISEQSGK